MNMNLLLKIGLKLFCMSLFMLFKKNTQIYTQTHHMLSVQSKNMQLLISSDLDRFKRIEITKNQQMCQCFLKWDTKKELKTANVLMFFYNFC